MRERHNVIEGKRVRPFLTIPKYSVPKDWSESTLNKKQRDIYDGNVKKRDGELPDF